MCGIAGFYTKRGTAPFSKDKFKSMAHTIRYRGPDDEGFYIDNSHHVGLSNTRLSIIGLNDGHQPFVSEDGNIVVVQNGEIYNFVELAQSLTSSNYPCMTRCDTEVLLRLYQRDGIDFVSQLNGMFSIAIYDRRIDALYLIRDRVGIKPLFVFQDKDILLFGSEIKALLAVGAPRIMNPEALHHLLSYAYVPPPYTMFKNITHVLPGHWLKIQGGQSMLHCWWDVIDVKMQQMKESHFELEFLSCLREAVNIRLRADVPYGAFLSGGVDSSTVVGLMTQCSDEKINTYSIGFEDARYDESKYALLAAKRFQTHHRSQRVHTELLRLWPDVIYHCDQPHSDVSFIPTYCVSKLAQQDLKLVLTGDGGDELFAGYDKHKDYFTKTVIDLSNREQFYQSYFEHISLFSENEKQSLYHEDFQHHSRDFDSYAVVAEYFNRSQQMDPINQALYLDVKLLLPGNNLVKPDRMGMATSLEARTPFLDVNMLNFAFSIPGELKLKDGETKYIYKKAVRKLIGEELAYRKKKMFTVPIGDWFKSHAQEMMRSLLLDERSLGRNIFKAEQIKKMIHDHCSEKRNCTRQLRMFIAIEIWHRVFIDNVSVDSIDLWECHLKCVNTPKNRLAGM